MEQTVFNENQLKKELETYQKLLDSDATPSMVAELARQEIERINDALNMPKVNMDELYEKSDSYTLPVVEDLSSSMEEAHTELEDVLSEETSHFAEDVNAILTAHKELTTGMDHENTLSTEERDRLKKMAEHPAGCLLDTVKDVIHARGELVQQGIEYQGYMSRAAEAIKGFPSKVNNNMVKPFCAATASTISNMIAGASNKFHSVASGYKSFCGKAHAEIKKILEQIDFSILVISERMTLGSYSYLDYGLTKAADKLGLCKTPEDYALYWNRVKGTCWGYEPIEKGSYTTPDGYIVPIAKKSPFENAIESAKNFGHNVAEKAGDVKDTVVEKAGNVKDAVVKAGNAAYTVGGTAVALTDAMIDDIAKGVKAKAGEVKADITKFGEDIDRAAHNLHRRVKVLALDFRADCIGKTLNFVEKAQTRLEARIEKCNDASMEIAIRSQNAIHEISALTGAKAAIEQETSPDMTAQIDALMKITPPDQLVTTLQEKLDSLKAETEAFLDDKESRLEFLDAGIDAKNAELDDLEKVTERLAKKESSATKILNKLNAMKEKLQDKADDVQAAIEFN